MCPLLSFPCAHFIFPGCLMMFRATSRVNASAVQLRVHHFPYCLSLVPIFIFPGCLMMFRLQGHFRSLMSCPLSMQWRSQGGGHSDHAPQRTITGGQHIFWPPQSEAGPLDPLGPLAEIDFLAGFRVPRDGSGPRGKHQGSCRTNPGSVGWARKTNQGPGRQIKTRQNWAIPEK